LTKFLIFFIGKNNFIETRLPCEHEHKVALRITIGEYLHMDRLYEGMNRVTIGET